MERGYLAHVKGKGETRGRNRHNNNSKIGAINLEERNVSTLRGKDSNMDLLALRI